ncbi:CobQ/CobB/MinD/ParA nucleotide binding domain protein [Halalkalicoccus paucihalophilus]|uniref:CobQ/CobB/MinD/ParA nucleotide binding domain protein n=1 Tax=Halalkalicoccus paucihalophilus TaxID=1008153 RepID=A0A151AB66_9EURY|nr:ParA family protein [Halalkalicoccus paucihalophilus]KYH24834.1 CobQ/CobB/MinD/ParA nucleotide binding domain protein [Halalkalicoccus paucihalophilus]
MLTYTPVSEAGGVGKTTTAATLAVSHAQAGHNVLAIDMDTQNGSLTYFFGPEYNRGDPQIDNLVRHLVGRPKGDFHDLTHEVEDGVDLIPSHNMLEDIHEFLLNEKNQAENLGESYSMYHQLHRVLQEANVRDHYDVIIVDSAGKAGPILYNALVAVRNVVIPFEATAKGQESIEGLDDLVDGLEESIGVDVGVLAVVPIGYKDTRDQREILGELRESGFSVPVIIGERGSLMEGCWKQQCSPYTYVEDHRNRKREYEIDTLEQFDELARHLEREAGLKIPEVTA